MKICYMSSILTTHDYKILLEMTKRFSDVYLVTYIDDDLPGNIAVLRQRGLNIIHHRPKYLHKLQKFLFFSKVRDFKKIIRDIKPDIIHSGFVWKDGFLAALSGFHPHLLMPWGCDVLRHPDMSRLCRQIVKYTLKKADAIVCDCLAVKARIEDMVKRKEEDFIIFSYGIDPKVFNKQNKGSGFRKKLGLENKKVLISTRNLYFVYNVKLIIKALPMILSQEPEVRVIIVGSGPEENNLKKIVKDMRLGDFVHFVGTVPNNELPVYLNDSDIYVSTSLSDGTSQSLMEALACGLPVVVTDVPANMEWVKDEEGGFIVSKADADMLAEKTIKLLRDPELREKMGIVNLEIAQRKADWNKNFDKLQKAYESFL